MFIIGKHGNEMMKFLTIKNRKETMFGILRLKCHSKKFSRWLCAYWNRFFFLSVFFIDGNNIRLWTRENYFLVIRWYYLTSMKWILRKKKLYTSIKQLVVQSQVSYINFKEPINYSRLSDEKDLIIFLDALTLYIWVSS